MYTEYSEIKGVFMFPDPQLLISMIKNQPPEVIKVMIKALEDTLVQLKELVNEK